jgi:putative membrane protein
VFEVSRYDTDGPDPSRRTMLAAERTWLAWWRTGMAAATAAVAVGGVVPELVDGGRTPYVMLGIGYAALSAAVMVGGWRRHRRVQLALARGEYEDVPGRWIAGLTIAGGVLSIATLAVIIAEA